MATASSTGQENSLATTLQEILSSVKSLQQEHSQLASAVDAINGRVNTLAEIKEVHDQAAKGTPAIEPQPAAAGHYHRSSDAERQTSPLTLSGQDPAHASPLPALSTSPAMPSSPHLDGSRRSSYSSKIILTSYPGQSGVDPVPMHWGSKDPNLRGPVVVSRNHNTIRKRNGV